MPAVEVSIPFLRDFCSVRSSQCRDRQGRFVLFWAPARTLNESLRLLCRRFRRHGDREEPVGQGAGGSGGAAEQEAAPPSCKPTCGGLVVIVLLVIASIVIIFFLVFFLCLALLYVCSFQAQA